MTVKQSLTLMELTINPAKTVLAVLHVFVFCTTITEIEVAFSRICDIVANAIIQ